MANVGYPSSILAPAKGMHAPDQAYVEYAGKVEGLDKESLIRALDDEMGRLVKSGGKTASTLMPYEEASKACGGSLPPYVEPGSRPRVVVILPDTEGCPCGGTHVEDVGDVGAFAVTGVRVKKGVTRVSYTVEGMKGHK
jgi:Ser-tRNA(Ala) deacylase AlaX